MEFEQRQGHHLDPRQRRKLTSGKKFSGNWVWNKNFWCRNGILDGKELGTDCQIFEIDGTSVRMAREKGKGSTTIYSLQYPAPAPNTFSCYT